MSRTLIGIAEVCERVGRSKSTIYEDMKRGQFPKPVSISRKARRWVEDEIDAFVQARIDERDQAGGATGAAA